MLQIQYKKFKKNWLSYKEYHTQNIFYYIEKFLLNLIHIFYGSFKTFNF